MNIKKYLYSVFTEAYGIGSSYEGIKKMKKRNIALVSSRILQLAQSVLLLLQAKKIFTLCHLSHHKHDHSIEVNRYFHFSVLVVPFIAAISIVCLILKYFFPSLIFL